MNLPFFNFKRALNSSMRTLLMETRFKHVAKCSFLVCLPFYLVSTGENVK